MLEIVDAVQSAAILLSGPCRARRQKGDRPMKYAILPATLVAASGAQAHPGHLAEVAGHGHWLGAAALGAAIAIGLWAGLKGRKDEASDEAEGEEPADEDLQEA
jgi:hypothetical protein